MSTRASVDIPIKLLLLSNDLITVRIQYNLDMLTGVRPNEGSLYNNFLI